MKIRNEITCPLEFVHDILKGKWKTIILWQLNYRKVSSLSQLKQDIKGISEKVLLEQLNELQRYDIVYKIKHDGYPLKVEYFLTNNKGKRIIKALEIFQEIGKEYLEEYQQKSK